MNREILERVYGKREPKPIGKHKFFSVLVPFVEKDGQMHMLYEVRAKQMISQPGEICFPGGHMEEGETAEECAVRETVEELGIPAKTIEVIGQGDTLFGYANYTLYTFIALIPASALKSANLAPEEVDEIFLMPWDKLVNAPCSNFPENVETTVSENFPYDKVGISRDYPFRVGKWDIPIIEAENRVIWGLTARITQEIIKNLMSC